MLPIDSSFESTLTWTEANQLRIITSDHARRLRGELLLAQAEGSPRASERAAKYKDADLLAGKVLTMYLRLSEAPAGTSRETRTNELR